METVEPIRTNYEDLFNFHVKSLGVLPGEPLPKSLVCHKSTLGRFLEHQNKGFGDQVGLEFTVDFELSVASYLHKSKLSEVSKPAKRSHLKNLQKSYGVYIRESAMPTDIIGAIAYLHKLSGSTLKAIAASTGGVVNKSILTKWVSGQNFPRKIEAVVALEKAYDVQSGVLTSLFPKKTHKVRERCQNVFSKQLKNNLADKYFLKELPAKLKNEWDKLLNFKTTDSLGGRERLGEWRGTTAEMNLLSLSSFFGFLARSKNDDPRCSGKGVELESMSLANFFGEVDPDDIKRKTFPNLEGYINYLRARNGGEYNGYTKSFINLISSIVHPEHGFMIQYPSLYSHVIDLEKEIKETHNWCKAFNKAIKKKIKKTRDPNLGCVRYIQAQHGLKHLIDMCDNARKGLVKYASREMTAGVAIRYRNVLMVELLTSNPLRQKNYRQMTWRADNTGHLRKYDDGSWWIEIPKDEFKNENGAAGDKDYKVQVNKELWPNIEFYINECRSVLLRGNTTDILLLSMAGGAGLEKHSYYDIICQTTYLYSSLETIGFGPHSFRHIIATDYIKNHPGGFQVVANILHDRLETVLENYAHITVSDGFSAWDQYLDDVKQSTRNFDKDGSGAASLDGILSKLGALSKYDRKRLLEVLKNA